MPKDFRIERFSFLSDDEDTGITAAEIESILNEHGGYQVEVAGQLRNLML